MTIASTEIETHLINFFRLVDIVYKAFMSDKIKIGSKIIEGGTAYEVFKIKNTKNGNGTQRVVFYKPCFDYSNSSDIVCSIPEHNINPPDMRKPVSKKEMEEVFIFLSKKTKSNAEVDIMKTVKIAIMIVIFENLLRLIIFYPPNLYIYIMILKYLKLSKVIVFNFYE